jgi:hypothetical protein
MTYLCALMQLYDSHKYFGINYITMQFVFVAPRKLCGLPPGPNNQEVKLAVFIA